MAPATLWAAILAGGAGTRFWPASRRHRPKQLLTLFGPDTLLAAAVERLQPLVPPARILVATGADLAPAVRAACPSLPAANVLGEPVPRDSAGAVVLAAAAVQARDPDATLAICTADHRIDPAEAFRSALASLQQVAEREQALGTFAVAPTHPETGYGYLRLGAPVGAAGGAWRVDEFVEKPDRATAERYVADGRYRWNSGMFVFPLPALRAALATHLPAHAAALQSLAAAFAGGGEALVLHQVFRGLPRVSIDYGLMEKEKAGRVVAGAAPFAWDDVGAWPAVARVHPADGDGNVTLGDAVLEDCRDVLAVSDGPLVAGFGLRDLLVVVWDGALLVCPRDRAADLKRLIERLRAEGREEFL